MIQAIQLTERLLLDNEIGVATLAGKRANYPSSNKAALTTGGSGTSWASYSSANSVPFTDIKNGKLAVIKGIAREPNAMLLSVDAARTLADHPSVKDLVKYVHQDALTISGLPKVLRGLAVIEGAAQKNTAAEGAAYSGGNIWQADDGTALALIFYRPATPSLRAVSMGYTFEAPDDATGARGLSVRRWREENRKGSMIEASFLRDWKLIAVDGSGLALGGYLLTSVTAEYTQEAVQSSQGSLRQDFTERSSRCLEAAQALRTQVIRPLGLLAPATPFTVEGSDGAPGTMDKW